MDVETDCEMFCESTAHPGAPSMSRDNMQATVVNRPDPACTATVSVANHPTITVDLHFAHLEGESHE